MAQAPTFNAVAYSRLDICNPLGVATLDAVLDRADLKPGDRIAVPRRIPVFGDRLMRDCEVKLLGYLIGDGGLTDTTPEFTNSNPRLRDEFTAAVREFGAAGSVFSP